MIDAQRGAATCQRWSGEGFAEPLERMPAACKNHASDVFVEQEADPDADKAKFEG